MKLTDIIVKTDVARAGMTVADAFRECVQHNVPGIPFCDDAGKVIGRFSIRHTLKTACIPEFLIHGAHLLGDNIDAVKIPEQLARDMLDMPVDTFVLDTLASVTAASPVTKAVSIMEKYNTGYIFLIDQDVYEGIVTRMGIAQLLLTLRED